MRAIVKIDKTNQTLKYDFDNLVTRDEVEQMAYSKHPALRQMKEDKKLYSDDFYITWHELDINGEIVTYDDVLDAPVEEPAAETESEEAKPTKAKPAK